MIQLSKRHGIATGTLIVLGYPGETESDFLETIEHLKRADPDRFAITDFLQNEGRSVFAGKSPCDIFLGIERFRSDMTKRIPAFALWLVLAVVAVAIPLACSSNSSSSSDGSSETTSDALTGG